MPLVFVHGVATRNSPERTAATLQRDALFRQLTFADPQYSIHNPDWGSLAPRIGDDPAWIPTPSGLQTFGNVDDADFRLAAAAERNGEGPVDALIGSILNAAVKDAAANNDPNLATDPDVIGAAKAAGDILVSQYTGSSNQIGVLRPLVAEDDQTVASALRRELASRGASQESGSLLSSGLSRMSDWVMARGSDALLSKARKSTTVWTARFIGDVIAYMVGYRRYGAEANKLLLPIVDSLATAWNERPQNQQLVAVGHSFGGVLLYETLCDPVCLAMLAEQAPGFQVDRLITVGSQLSLFADLGLFEGLEGLDGLGRPKVAKDWWNVVDYTDPIGFLCGSNFKGVSDFGYDTGLDLLQSHTAYFSRPSFYSRLSVRLAGR